jgi:hypothetical protein
MADIRNYTRETKQERRLKDYTVDVDLDSHSKFESYNPPVSSDHFLEP